MQLHPRATAPGGIPSCHIHLGTALLTSLIVTVSTLIEQQNILTDIMPCLMYNMDLPACQNDSFDTPLPIIHGHHSLSLRPENAVTVKLPSQIAMLPQAIT